MDGDDDAADDDVDVHGDDNGDGDDDNASDDTDDYGIYDDGYDGNIMDMIRSDG